MFDVISYPDGFDINFSSHVHCVDEVASCVERFLNQKKLQHIVFDVVLILREGILNAIIHGNKYDSEKIVRFQFRLLSNRVVIHIEDMGNGFDLQGQFKKYVSSTSDSGRGLVIMQHYADALTYDEVKKTLVLVKHINGVKTL